MSTSAVSASAFAGELLCVTKSPLVFDRLNLSAVRDEFVNDDSFITELTNEIANAILWVDETGLHRFVDEVLRRMAESYLKKGGSNEGLQALQEIVKFILKAYAEKKCGMVHNFIARYNGNSCVYFDNYIFNTAFMALIRMKLVKGGFDEVNTDNFAGKAFKAHLSGASFDEVCKVIEEDMSKGKSHRLINLCYNLGKAPSAMNSLVSDLTKNYSTELSFMISAVVGDAVANYNTLHNGNISELLVAHLAGGEDDADIVETITQSIRVYNGFILSLLMLVGQ